MKISVLTPTYNRAGLLKKLYNSLIVNSKYHVEIEWLIMDDGSTDNTKEIIDKFINDQKIEIKYFWQENQGKMIAINNLVLYATGDLIIDCDSDDYFADNAFEIIKKAYNEYPNDNKKFYGMCFLKFDTKGNNMGHDFKNQETTMFDLYFKEGEDGEKTIVFYSDIRKQFKHELEHNENFVTEARMYHKMDEKYKMICYNEPVMICEYQEEGYTKNILQQFEKYPFGYFEYFKEILKKNMHGVKFKKRLYAIKHYILFENLTNQFDNTAINGFINKLLHIILFLPGKCKTRKLFLHENESNF